MTDYSDLVRKMRTCIGDKKCFEKECRYWSELGCMDGNICCDAADAIEALQAEQKKTVTQIFCEEQMAWEGRCKDLMKNISDLQAEVERLKDSNEELREKQTFIDHWGVEWLTSAKDVPTAAYKHGYADGRAEVKAQLPKHGKWILCGQVGWPNWKCSVCYSEGRGDYIRCPWCGAVMDESNASNASNALNALENAQDGQIITPCRGCSDYDGYGGCKSKGGCARAKMEVQDGK